MLPFREDIDAVDEEGRSTLLRACQTRMSANVISRLLAMGANVNLSDDNGNSPLHWAVGEGASSDVVKLLLDNGADVNCQSTSGFTPLHYAVMSIEPFHDVCALLLDKGADVNINDPSGNAPLNLHLKSKGCSYRMTKLLIQRGADLNARLIDDIYNLSSLDVAVGNEDCDMKIVELLILSGCDPSIEKMSHNEGYVSHGLYYRSQKEVVEFGKLLIKHNLLKSYQIDVETASILVGRSEMQKSMRDMDRFKFELREMKDDIIETGFTLYDFIRSSNFSCDSEFNIEPLRKSTWSVTQFLKYPLYKELLMHKVPRQLILQQQERSCNAINLKCGKVVFNLDSLYHITRFLSKEDMLNFGVYLKDV